MKNKTIILTVTNDLVYDRRMFRICSALAAEGAKITLVGRKHKDSKVFEPGAFKGKRIRCWFNKGSLFYAEYNIRLFFYLLGQSFDIACACDLDTALAVRLACFFKRKKSVYDAHEYFSEVPELIHRPVIKGVWNFIGKMTIPGFHVCYTVGDELAYLMGKKFGVHFHVIRNIAPAPLTNSIGSQSHREKIVLYQGALNVGRGLEACIKSMAVLPEWEFWLAGEGDITNQLKELAINTGVGNRVKFLGWVKPEDLPALMQQAKLGINLRETGSLNDFYSLPNKFFDAINAGLPSINMNYPEYAAVCKKYPCALLIDEVDVDTIVQSIKYLDQNPDVWQSMSNACLEAAKEFTWEKESAKLIRLYEDLN